MIGSQGASALVPSTPGTYSICTSMIARCSSLAFQAFMIRNGYACTQTEPVKMFLPFSAPNASDVLSACQQIVSQLNPAVDFLLACSTDGCNNPATAGASAVVRSLPRAPALAADATRPLVRGSARSDARLAFVFCAALPDQQARCALLPLLLHRR